MSNDTVIEFDLEPVREGRTAYSVQLESNRLIEGPEAKFYPDGRVQPGLLFEASGVHVYDVDGYLTIYPWHQVRRASRG